MYSSRFLVGFLMFAASSGASNEAWAHIRLSDPIARYEITGADTGIKGCPCGIATGGGNSNRTCNVELDGSDPARDEERASTYPAGSTITLKFEEYIGHAGRYRVAFDPDGADFEDFNANVIHDESDPGGSEGNIGDGTKWEIEVTLPNTPCDNCTLQLLQVMAGGTENPVDASRLATLSTYYACIDLTLTAPEGNTSDEGSDSSTGAASSEGTQTSEDNTSGEESGSNEAATSSAETTNEASSSQAEDTSSDQATSTRPNASSSTTTAPTSPTSTATSAPNTSTAATTTATATGTATTTQAGTSIDPEEEPSGGDDDGGGCSIVNANQTPSILFGLGIAAFAALFARRRRAF